MYRIIIGLGEIWGHYTYSPQCKGLSEQEKDGVTIHIVLNVQDYQCSREKDGVTIHIVLNVKDYQ